MMTTTTYNTIFLNVCLLLSIAVALPCHAGDAALTVRLLTPAVAQGGTAFFMISAPDATAVTVHEGPTTIRAEARENGVWEAVLAVSMTTPPATRIISIEAASADSVHRAQVGLLVRKRHFPIQRLRMSREDDAKYTAPSVHEEYRLIGAALRHETARAWQGAFQLPVAGRLSTLFGVQRYRNGKKVGAHKGIDIAAPRGCPVYAANAGVVTLCRTFGLHGRTVVLDHGVGIAGLYLHLRDFVVTEGQSVVAGQLIGHVGSTGAATGPNLHYGIYIHGVPVDPLLLRSVPDGW